MTQLRLIGLGLAGVLRDTDEAKISSATGVEECQVGFCSLTISLMPAMPEFFPPLAQKECEIALPSLTISMMSTTLGVSLPLA